MVVVVFIGCFEERAQTFRLCMCKDSINMSDRLDLPCDVNGTEQHAMIAEFSV